MRNSFTRNTLMRSLAARAGRLQNPPEASRSGAPERLSSGGLRNSPEAIRPGAPGRLASGGFWSLQKLFVQELLDD